MKSSHFESQVHALLIKALIYQKPTDTTAVILERFARGGGQVRWYYLPYLSKLNEIETMWRPGSSVSLYFDNRIKFLNYSNDIATYAKEILLRDREVLLGKLDSSLIKIEMEIISGPIELSEYVANISLTEQVFCGAFPGKDNDGVNAVTVIIPDEDGAVRNHPY